MIILCTRHEFAKKFSLKGQEVTEFKEWKNKAYRVTMVDMHGTKHRMKALGIKTITSAIYPVNISRAIHLLKVPLQDVARPAGPVDLLVGLNVEPRTKRFELGTGYLID